MAHGCLPGWQCTTTPSDKDGMAVLAANHDDDATECVDISTYFHGRSISRASAGKFRSYATEHALAISCRRASAGNYTIPAQALGNPAQAL